MRTKHMLIFFLSCCLHRWGWPLTAAETLEQELSERGLHLDRESWEYYKCDGKERERAQSCIQKGEPFSLWVRRQMQNESYENLACYADKSAAKHYARTTIPGLQAPVTLGVFTESNVQELLTFPLPAQYAFKASHGSNMALMVSQGHLYTGNRGKLRAIQSVSARALVRLALSFMRVCYECNTQLQYRRTRKAALLEEFLGEGFPADYKAYMFGGQVYAFDVRQFKVVNSTDGRVRRLVRRAFSRDGNELTAQHVMQHFGQMQLLPSDDVVQQIFTAAKKLGDGFRFVRVDFYYMNDVLYFGELTLSPQAGSRRLDRWFHPQTTVHIGTCGDS